MTASDRTIDPIAIAVSVVRVLDALGIANTIGGSIASSFAGEPRSTIDIDIVAAIEARHIPDLVTRFTPAFYLDSDALHRAVTNRSSTNLIHQASMLKIDLFTLAVGSRTGSGATCRASFACRAPASTSAIGERMHPHSA